MAPKLMEDESGVNILIEYIINFAIMLILFTVILLTYQSLMTHSNNNTTEEQLTVVANDIANKITLFDGIITSTETHGTTGTAFISLSQTFDMQTQLSGNTYYVDVYYSGSSKEGYVIAHTADTRITPVKVGFIANHPLYDPIANQLVSLTHPVRVQSAETTHAISYTSHGIEVT